MPQGCVDAALPVRLELVAESLGAADDRRVICGDERRVRDARGAPGASRQCAPAARRPRTRRLRERGGRQVLRHPGTRPARESLARRPPWHRCRPTVRQPGRRSRRGAAGRRGMTDIVAPGRPGHLRGDRPAFASSRRIRLSKQASRRRSAPGTIPPTRPASVKAPKPTAPAPRLRPQLPAYARLRRRPARRWSLQPRRRFDGSADFGETEKRA